MDQEICKERSVDAKQVVGKYETPSYVNALCSVIHHSHVYPIAYFKFIIRWRKELFLVRRNGTNSDNYQHHAHNASRLHVRTKDASFKTATRRDRRGGK